MGTERINIGLVIMASGIGKRFGSNKLMENVHDKPLIKWILDTTDGLFDRRVVVTRSSDVNDLCKSLNIDCIMHEFPLRSDTVRVGLSAVMDDVDYCFFAPADQPLIKRESIAKLINEAQENKDMIVRTAYDKTVGSPVGFPRLFYDELLRLPQGAGGGFVAKNNPALIHTVEMEDEYELWDVDTVSDLEKIKKTLKI